MIRRLATVVSASPRLRRVLVRALDRVPGIKRRLKVALASRAALDAAPHDPALVESLLSLEARRVLGDLLRARDRVAAEPAPARDES